MYETRILSKIAGLTCMLAAFSILPILTPPAHAYGNTAQWQIGVSFNCNSPTFCTPFQGGFWGWVEFDNDGTGDATLTGCGHLVAAGSPGAGADHFNVEIEGWTVMPGSAGPLTFFVLGGTMTFTGGTGGPPVTVPISPLPLDTGFPAVAGHFTTSMILGFSPPPGVALVIQVVHIPNR